MEGGREACLASRAERAACFVLPAPCTRLAGLLGFKSSAGSTALLCMGSDVLCSDGLRAAQEGGAATELPLSLPSSSLNLLGSLPSLDSSWPCPPGLLLLRKQGTGRRPQRAPLALCMAQVQDRGRAHAMRVACERARAGQALALHLRRPPGRDGGQTGAWEVGRLGGGGLRGGPLHLGPWVT